MLDFLRKDTSNCYLISVAGVQLYKEEGEEEKEVK
jgi:hypothetical protein